MPVQRSHDKLYPLPPVAGEMPSAPEGAAVPLPDRDAHGRIRSSAAARALARLPRRRDMLPAGLVLDSRFKPFNRSRLEWLRKRRAEVCTATGGCSHGVGAMLNAAAWSYAAGEFAAMLAAERGDVDLFQTAASLTTTARGHDAMAWDLAVKESKQRPKESAIDRLRKRLDASAEKGEATDAGA
jgi:hypothetical protein